MPSNFAKSTTITASAVVAVTAFTMLMSGLVASQASAAGYTVEDTAITDNFPRWDRLNIRKWPASYSKKIAHIKREIGRAHV